MEEIGAKRSEYPVQFFANQRLSEAIAVGVNLDQREQIDSVAGEFLGQRSGRWSNCGHVEAGLPDIVERGEQRPFSTRERGVFK